MADGFIVRKGGAVTEQALAPTITEVSTTTDSITFTITNNDASSAVISWEVGDTTPDANSIELAAAATSSNITVDTLDDDTEYTVSATASVTGKVLSNVTSLAIETDEIIEYALDFDGTDDSVSISNNATGNVKRFEIVFTPGQDYTASTTVGFLMAGPNVHESEIYMGTSTGTIPNETLIISNPDVSNIAYYAAGTFTNGTEYTLVGVWNGSNRYDLTLNGSSVSHISGTNTIIDASDFEYLGRRSGDELYYNGKISYLKLTDTSDTDILEYLFDEGTGSTLNDNIGTSDGTITGATWVTL
jgi:hypothetical protein